MPNEHFDISSISIPNNSTYKNSSVFNSSSMLEQRFIAHKTADTNYTANNNTDIHMHSATSFNDDSCYNFNYADFIQSKFQDNERLRNTLVAKLSDELEQALYLFPYESETLSVAERKIIEIEHTYSMLFLGDVIQNVYVKLFDRPEFLIGICKSLLRYDLSEVMPWGAVILPSLLNHKDESVQEYAIALVDNWEDIQLLPMLHSLQVSSSWLKDYINDVVKNLEKKQHVLRKKIV